MEIVLLHAIVRFEVSKERLSFPVRLFRFTCKNRARIIQELCKNRARIMRESYKNHTRIMQESCKNRARIVQESCKPMSRKWRAYEYAVSMKSAMAKRNDKMVNRLTYNCHITEPYNFSLMTINV